MATTPQPPTHLEMPDAQLLFTIGGAIPLVVVVFLAVKHIVDGRGPLLAVCLLGGALTSFYEPLVDVMGLVYLTENGSYGTFTILDRTMPLFVPLIYPWYVGGLAYVTCRRIERGVTPRDLFALWGVFILINFALEAPGLLTDVYTYYGNQPLNLWGHPMWFGCVNAFTALAGGALVYAARPYLGDGWRLLGVVPLLFAAETVSNAGTGFPMYATLNADLGYGWTYAAAALTIGTIAYLVWLIGRMVSRTPAPELEQA